MSERAVLSVREQEGKGLVRAPGGGTERARVEKQSGEVFRTRASERERERDKDG